MTYNSAQQLVNCYETLGMAPEQIAEGLSLDLAVVKAGLMQYSVQYRKTVKSDKALDFTDDELELANKTITDLMQYSEDENLRGRLARYIRDDKKGRLEPVPNAASLGAGLNININLLQQHLSQVEARLASANKQAIPIPAREAKMLHDARISTLQTSEKTLA